MATPIGSELLRKLVAARATLPEEVVDRVFVAFCAVANELLDGGAKIRILNGYLEQIVTKPTRRPNPNVPGEIVDVPARKKIVFRDARKR
jgi:nucleoid DNA-binding protein